MKSKFEMVIRDRVTGKEVFSLDIDSYKYRFEAGAIRTLTHIAPSGQATEYLGKSKATFSLSGYLSNDEEPACIHTWNHYRGLEEEYEFCKHCGINRNAL